MCSSAEEARRDANILQRAMGGAVLRRRVAAGVGGGCGVSSGRRGAGTAGPSSDFSEVGEQLRITFFELLAPSSNRLVSAYIPTRTLAEISQGKALNGLEVYGLAEVPRQAEYTDCTPQVFQQLLKSVEPIMGNLDAEKIGRFAEEVNARLQSLGTSRSRWDARRCWAACSRRRTRLDSRCCWR